MGLSRTAVLRSLVCLSLLPLSLGCGPESVASLSGEDDEGLELSASELNATFVVQLVNSADVTVDVLTQQVRIDARAANGLVAGRPFTTLAQVDAVPYVGATALRKLDAFATARFAASGVTVEGVVFTATEAADTVALANAPQLADSGLSATAVANLTARRPFASVVAIGAVTGIGPAALTTLRTYVRAHPGGVTPSSTCTGGTWDGVTFSRDEACHAVDFLNRARFSEMGALPDGARLVAYEEGPDGRFDPTRVRGAVWSSVAQFAAVSGIGTTATAGLKTGAAGWTANGASADTVASSWSNRVALLGLPVYLDSVVVTKVLPQTGDDGGFNWECAEVRDVAGAPNFMLACKPAVVCGGSCWSGVALGSTATRIHGTVRRSSIAGSGGYRISLSN